jgi:Na+/H+-dicarboxylate symporter
MLALSLLVRMSPVQFLTSAREALLLAFSTSSSAAVMPLTMRTLQNGFRVRPSVAQFVVPLGATINMDGTALYQAVATVFLAQAFGVEMSVPTMMLVGVTAVGASIGTPSTPGVGIVILASVLTAAGVPTAGIALIIGVDRILDMSRTTLNVAGDMVASIILDRWLGARFAGLREIVEEQKREEERRETGEDVIVEQ